MLMHDLTLGPVSPIVALLFAALGALLGILLAARARRCTGLRRARLVAYGTVAVGLPAVWLPAMVAIMAVRVDGSVLLLPAVSLATSVGAALVGTSAGMLLLCCGRRTRADRVIAAGILMVGTIAATGYLLLRGLRTGGEVDFSPPLAAAALTLAAVTGLAVTGALALTPTLRSALILAAVVGALLSACQHLATASMFVRLGSEGPVPAYDITGIEPLAFGLPALLLCAALIAMTWYFTVGAATGRDLRRIFQHGAQTEHIAPAILAQVRARVSLSSTAFATAEIGDSWSQGTLPMRAIPLYAGGISGAFVRPLVRQTVPTATEASWHPEPDEFAAAEPAVLDGPSVTEQPWRAVPDWNLPTAEWALPPDTAEWLAQGRGAGGASHWDQAADAGEAAPRNEPRASHHGRPTNSRYGPMPRRGSGANAGSAPTRRPDAVPVPRWGGAPDEFPTFTRVNGAGPLPRRNAR